MRTVFEVKSKWLPGRAIVGARVRRAAEGSMKSFMGSVTRSKNTDVERMHVEMRVVYLLNEGLFLELLGKKMPCNLV